MNEDLKEKARIARNLYVKNWREKNKGKLEEIRNRSYIKRAEEMGLLKKEGE